MHHEESNRWYGNMCTVTELIFHHVQEQNHGEISNPSPVKCEKQTTVCWFLMGKKHKQQKMCSQLPQPLKLDLVLKQILSINLLHSELILLPKQLTNPTHLSEPFPSVQQGLAKF